MGNYCADVLIHRGAGIIDEHLLAGDVGLTHGRVEPATPISVEIAEPAIAVAIAVNGAVRLAVHIGRRNQHPNIEQCLQGRHALWFLFQ